MTAKVLVCVLILVGVLGGMIWGMSLFSETMEELLSLSSRIISSQNDSESIEALYEFDETFTDSITLLSMFLHDSLLEEVDMYIVEIRSSFFSGDRESAVSFASALIEKLMQLQRSMAPTLENIL